MTLPDPGSSRRTRIRRLPENAVHDRATLNEILDEGLVAHIAITGKDGWPRCVPCSHARDGDRLLLHGSRASRTFRRMAAGAPIAVNVALLDGIVYARSLFSSSMNYRSATILGVADPIPAADLAATLLILSERLLPGRVGQARDPNERELAQTAVVALSLAECAVKISNGSGADDGDGDGDLPIWAGVLPLRLAAEAAQDAPDLMPGHPVPDYVAQRFRTRTDASC